MFFKLYGGYTSHPDLEVPKELPCASLLLYYLIGLCLMPAWDLHLLALGSKQDKSRVINPQAGFVAQQTTFISLLFLLNVKAHVLYQ